MKTVGVYVWANMTLLDAIGPQQVLAFVPELHVVTVAQSMDPVVGDTRLRVLPDCDFDTCPAIDVLLVGGGIDPSSQLRDEVVMGWVRRTGEAAEFVTAVGTGSLILAEAGLLDGHHATTHWAYTEQLTSYPEVELGEGRIVADGTRVTCGGATAGLDLGFALVALLAGSEMADRLQLIGEYDPQPMTACGNPATAPAELVASVRAELEDLTPGLAAFYAAGGDP